MGLPKSVQFEIPFEQGEERFWVASVQIGALWRFDVRFWKIIFGQ